MGLNQRRRCERALRRAERYAGDMGDGMSSAAVAVVVAPDPRAVAPSPIVFCLAPYAQHLAERRCNRVRRGGNVYIDRTDAQ